MPFVTPQFGPEKSEKFERCVQAVKTQQGIKENLKEDKRKQSSLLLLKDNENKQLKQKNKELIR